MSSSSLALGTAGSSYDALIETDKLPSPPLYAAKLSGLLKSLDSASSAISNAISTRKEVIAGLESLLQINQAALESDIRGQGELFLKKNKVEETLKEVEVMIAEEGNMEEARSTTPEMAPPAVEALTPPHSADLLDLLDPDADPLDRQEGQGPGPGQDADHGPFQFEDQLVAATSENVTMEDLDPMLAEMLARDGVADLGRTF